MPKGAILDESLVQQVGLGDQLLTLSAPIENRNHAILQEPMFILRTDELTEPVHLERKYVFDNQLSIKSSYAKGDRILAWIVRNSRPNPHDAKAPPVDLLIARDLFLLGDWREFQRFKQFIKSMRILDAQARQWLTDHHGELEVLSGTAEGLARIINVLGRIAEWPEVEGAEASRSTSFEVLAKTFSRDLLHVRDAPLFSALILRSDPQIRLNVFRIMGFVEDPARGAAGLFGFITTLARATRDPENLSAVADMKTSRDLARAFAALRKYLLSPKVPA